MILKSSRIVTPIGPALLFVSDGALCGLAFEDRSFRLRRLLNERFGGWIVEEEADPSGIVTRLGAYFEGDLGALDTIYVDPQGTPFQRAVWEALRGVRAGSTATCARIAALLGRAAAARGVALASARNPVAIVVPCHRVVRSDGNLTEYVGGLDRKRWLLRHEGARV